MSKTTDIRQYSLPDLQAELTAIGQPTYRAAQIYEWLWKKGASDFDQMTNLSKALRESLASQFTFHTLTEDKIQRSADGTYKFRFALHDGHKIESVLIPVPEDHRYTVCVSTQVGCSLTCSFCATGRMGRIRNLDAAEIFDQVVRVNCACLEAYEVPLTNIVYMGMGEPLLNYKNTLSSVAHLTAAGEWGMSPRRITVSTAGIAKMIRQLADDNVRFNLALSLHAADDEKRNQIMPINESNHLAVLMEALAYFYQKTRNRISYEYIAFQHFNDGIDDARNLARLCHRFPVRVNIIEYNPIADAPFAKSEGDRLDAFAQYLTAQGVTVTVRRSRGKDIDAACGQLANKE